MANPFKRRSVFAGLIMLAILSCFALTSAAQSERPETVKISEADHWRYVAEFRLLQLNEAWQRLGLKTARDVELAQDAFSKTHNDMARAYGLSGDDYFYNVLQRGFVPKKGGATK